MNKNQLFTQLNSLCREMDEFYDINSGGCCFIASVIAEQLEKFNISYSFIRIDYGRHYVIEVSDRVLNGDGYRRDSSHFEYLGFDSKEGFIYYKKHNWNNCYSKKWNLIVKTKIESLFNKYGNKRT